MASTSSSTSSKPSLSSLPSEILVIIVRYLGPAFFQRSIAILSLFKQWYPIAQAELRKDVVLTDANLVPLYQLSCGNPLSGMLPEWTKGQTRTITFRLGVEKLLQYRDTSMESSDSCLYDVLEDLWEDVDVSGRLIESINRLQRLEILRLIVQSEVYTSHEFRPKDRPQSYIGLWNVTARKMLRELRATAPPSLTRLELDFHGERFFSFLYGYADVPRPHLCSTINHLFDWLHHLRDIRVRLACVCHDLLSARRRTRATLPLDTLVVNLSLCENSRMRCQWCGPYSWNCELPDRPNDGDCADLGMEMKDAASEFATLMKEPKMVRIIDCVPSETEDDPDLCQPVRFDELAWDCLAQRSCFLEPGDDWARTGHPLTEGYEVDEWETDVNEECESGASSIDPGNPDSS